MIGPEHVAQWARSAWNDYLRSIIDSANYFPIRLDRVGQVPASVDPQGFATAVTPLWNGSKAVRGFGYTVVLESRQRRSRQSQNEPVAVEVETEDDYLRLLDYQIKADNFRRDLDLVRSFLPQTIPALRMRPDVVVDNHGSWDGILEVVDYLRRHPRPGCYVRALPVRVPTKFIESHRFAIETLLAAVPESLHNATGKNFDSRCGFAEDDNAIRGRFLDEKLQRNCGFGASDVSLRVGTWAGLQLPAGVRIIACENKTNFLALPPMEGVLALFGEGGAATGHFLRLPWLAQHRFIYWGDLDPCGFAILAKLRRAIPTVQSMLMDEETLQMHRDKFGDAKPAPHGIAMEHLNERERAAATTVENAARGLEQEKLLFDECLKKLREVLLSAPV